MEWVAGVGRTFSPALDPQVTRPRHTVASKASRFSCERRLPYFFSVQHSVPRQDTGAAGDGAAAELGVNECADFADFMETAENLLRV